MVCSFGKGRMAVLARFLPNESVPYKIAGEISQKKLPGHSTYQDFREADEANLLNEEDMHVFGLEPMSDPLHLVFCNACKKPVTASHYAAHWELCQSLCFGKEMQLQVKENERHRKPPRKAKKKLLVDDKNESPFSHLNGSSINVEVQKKGEIVPQRTSLDNSVKSPPAKRLKIISRQHPLQRHCSQSPSTMEIATNFPHQNFCLQQSVAQSGTNSDVSTEKLNDNQFLLRNSTAMPIATKIYYSQRNRRLRSAFAHFYHMSASSQLPNGKNLQSLSRDRSNILQDNLKTKEPKCVENKPASTKISHIEKSYTGTAGVSPL